MKGVILSSHTTPPLRRSCKEDQSYPRAGWGGGGGGGGGNGGGG